MRVDVFERNVGDWVWLDLLVGLGELDELGLLLWLLRLLLLLWL